MVQIIPRVRSSGERLAEAFGNMGESASQLIPQELMGRKERKALGNLTGQDLSDIRNPDFLKQILQNEGKQKSSQADQERKQNIWQEIENSEEGKKLTPIQKLALKQEIMGNLSGQTGKSLINAEREGTENEFLSNLLGGQQNNNTSGRQQSVSEVGQQGLSQQEEMQPSNLMQGIEEEPIKKSKSVLQNLSDNDLDIMLAKGGRPAELAKSEKSRRLEEGKMGFRKEVAQNKEVRASYTENKPFIDKTHDQYEDSLRRDAIIDRMNQLNDSDELSDSGAINFLESVGLQPEWLKNPKNEEYTKLSLDLLGGGTLQADYGSRVLQSEFQVAQQRVPTLSQTKEGRRQIAENLRTMLLPAKLKNERMEFYLDQAERTGKPLPHDLRGKILKDVKPQLEEAYDKFKQRNGRYKVKEGTYPDDNALEKYYYLSNANEDAAIKMMKEDGYDISS